MNNPYVFGAPDLPLGAPAFGTPVTEQAQQAPSPTPLVSSNMAISFAADHGGCGFWRMHWPEALINSSGRGVVTNSTMMLLDPRYYAQVKSVKIQRQVTGPQLEFAKFLRQTSNNGNKFKMYYEIDDVIFPEDIPLYNKSRAAFVDPVIGKTAIEIIRLCDAITCPTKFMADYYTEKTGVPAIVLPNYLPRFWMDRFYNKDKVKANFDNNVKRPRIGYVGSPTHLNVDRVQGIQDDIDPFVPYIRKTIKKYKWVFMGGVPYDLYDLVQSGDIEYVPWKTLYDYSYAFDSLNLNVAIAPLQNNKFNYSKAPIKYLEAGALGVPCVCQDAPPYNTDPVAPLRFNTPDEAMDLIKKLCDNRRIYLTESDHARKIATKYWLEDHIEEHAKVYFPS
jgi:glycosyltransferase involved in cell wall biosynthesis